MRKLAYLDQHQFIDSEDLDDDSGQDGKQWKETKITPIKTINIPFYKIQITKFRSEHGQNRLLSEKTDVLHQKWKISKKMESYLRERYDVKKYLAGEDRNALIVFFYMVDVAFIPPSFYISADQIPDLRIIQYNKSEKTG